MADPRFSAGLMNIAVAGRYLRIPRQTFHRRARGYERGKPLIHLRPGGGDQFPVTFIALAEAHVLEALREAGVRPQKIRPALERLKKLLAVSMCSPRRNWPLRHRLPSKVIVDVHRAFGQPIFEGSGVRVVDVAGMKAGESAEAVAEEFGRAA